MPISDAYTTDAYAAFTNSIDATDNTNTAATHLPAPEPSMDPYSEFLSRIDD